MVHEPRLTDHARTVLERRYLKRDQAGHPLETPGEMFMRVATGVAGAETLHGPAGLAAEYRDRFFRMMVDLEFLPNSPMLINAGRELGQLSACFVLPVEDSIESIFNAVRDTALIHKSGGGTGFSFSRLRPANDTVQTTQGVSSGPVSFMNVFDMATETIKQGGVRRGANMGILSVHHPDIMEFIAVKTRHPDRLSNFNLSVSATDRFMEAVREGRDYELVNPRQGQVQQKISARKVMEALAESAWSCGDPGLVFIDRINEANTVPDLGPMEATNPCGEQPLLPYESCTLGSINITRFLAGDKIDWPRLRETVHLAVRFLDDAVDVNRYPLTQIEKTTKANRKIGLGVMGLADMFIGMGLPYDDPAAPDISRNLMFFIRKEAWEASRELGRIKGNFPNYHRSVFPGRGTPMRNATTTTIAPTGSLSIIAGCSSGIEPLFGLAFQRRILDGSVLTEVHSGFRRMAEKEGLWTEKLAAELARVGTARRLNGVPGYIKRLFVTAHDLSPRKHLDIQAAFQAHTDNAVSKTVNLPRSTSREAVLDIFLTAFDMGLKGVTVYRDGSKQEQVLSFGSDEPLETLPLHHKNTTTCPECGGTLINSQGCWSCRECGYSHCLGFG